MKPHETWARAAEWAGLTITPAQIGLLQRYANWLSDEAIRAGALGPGETERIDRRHIGDSILFARFVQGMDRIVDFGSGAGLPGIPTAILFPRSELLLVDRSGRRTELMRRVVRILDLSNVQVVTGEIDDIAAPVPAIVSRATLTPDVAREQLAPLLEPGGVLVLGGSWSEPPMIEDWDIIEVPAAILDQKVWLLMMRSP